MDGPEDRPPRSDALAPEYERLSEASAAFDAWRGAAVPPTWERRATRLGTAYGRGSLCVRASLHADRPPPLRTLRLSVLRTNGPVTPEDLRAVVEDFVDAASVERVRPLDRSMGPHVIGASWVVRVEPPAAGVD